MGKCWNCKNKIQYNEFVIHKGQVLCPKCFSKLPKKRKYRRKKSK